MLKLSPLAIGLSLAMAVMGAQAQSVTGPQSSQTPYVVPTATDWGLTSLLAVGDSANKVAYRI